MDSTLKILDNGDKIYLKNGFVHREDGPAVIRKIGENLWYKDGILHREDGPAVEKTNGTKNTKQNKTPQVKKIKQYLIEINGVKYKKKSKK